MVNEATEAVVEEVATVARAMAARNDCQQVGVIPHVFIYLPDWHLIKTDQWVFNTICDSHQWKFHTSLPLSRGQAWQPVHRLIQSARWRASSAIPLNFVLSPASR